MSPTNGGLLLVVAVATAAIFAAGLACGYLAMRQALALAARYQQTGRVLPPAPAPRSGPVLRTPEGRAHAAAMQDSIDRGAAQLMEAAEAQGVPISRKQAEEQARHMIAAADPLGGSR